MATPVLEATIWVECEVRENPLKEFFLEQLREICPYF